MFLFVDGLGVGSHDPGVNPVAAAALPNLKRIAGGDVSGRAQAAGDDSALAPSSFAWWAHKGLDATLGVSGLPQSGTGQTALLTGMNASAHIGRHYGPYPDAALRLLLDSHSLWRRLRAEGRSTALANAFPDRYLDRVREGVGRMGAMARAAHQAGVRLRGPDELRDGRAVSAFLTNDLWRTRLNHTDLPTVSEAEAGALLGRLVSAYDFTLFEYYATDIVGHRGDVAGATHELERLDEFVGGVLRACAFDTTIVLASDHGNVEDMSTRKHTRNPALAGWYGPLPPPKWRTIADVAPAILGALGVPPTAPVVGRSG